MAEARRYLVTTQKQVAAFFGVSAQTVQNWLLRGMPETGGRYDLSAIAKWRESLRADRRRPAPPGVDDDEMMLAPGSSPALEKFREERAALARLDRLEREGSLLPRGQVHEGLARLATILRGAGDALQRQFGAEAHALLDEALDDVEREIREQYGTPDDDPPDADA